MRKIATSSLALLCAAGLAAAAPAFAQNDLNSNSPPAARDGNMPPDKIAPPLKLNEHATPADAAATPDLSKDNVAAAPDPAAAPDKSMSNENTAAIMPGALASGSHRVSRIIGEPVVNDLKDRIGKIDDIVIGPDDRAVYAVVSVGGFLGVGAKLVAVPYSDLKPGPDHTFILPGATKEQLKSLPEFSYSHGA